MQKKAIMKIKKKNKKENKKEISRHVCLHRKLLQERKWKAGDKNTQAFVENNFCQK